MLKAGKKLLKTIEGTIKQFNFKVAPERRRQRWKRDPGVCSCWQIVNNDSDDVTSAGKSFQIHGPTTGKAWLATAWQAALPDG